MSRRALAERDQRGPQAPRVVFWAPEIGAWLLLLLAAGIGGVPGGAAAQTGPASTATSGDSAHAPIIVWPEITTLVESGKVRDVAFSDPGLNIVSAVEMAWCADAETRALIAVATKPIAGTAEAGEEVGRRGEGAIGDPAALYVGPAGQFVLGQDARLLVLRSGWTDTLALAPANGPARDLAVSSSGLVYLLLGNEVRIYTAALRGSPLWTIPVPRKVGPAVAMAVSARGEVFVAGRQALAVFELHSDGTFRQVRSRSLGDLEMEAVGGVALTPALLVPLEGREGWAGRDRFLVLSDAGKPAMVALESSSLESVGRIDFGVEVPGAVPGRLDVSNRSQIAFVDSASGRALALPARLFARLIEGATIRWRNLEPDSTAAGSAGP